MPQKNKRNSLKFCSLVILNLLLLSLLVSAQTNGKIFILTLNYKSAVLVQTLTLVDVRVGDGTPQDFSAVTKGDYKLELVSSDDKILKKINFNIPIQQNQQDSINLDFTMGIPYYNNAKTINIYDSGNNKVLEKQLTSNVQSPSTSSWIYIALPLIAILGLLVLIEFNRRKSHAKLIDKVNPQNTLNLRNYVVSNLKRGSSKEQIRSALVKNGYTNQEIDNAFKIK